MLKLLVSPLTQGAYFNELEKVALAEVQALYPDVHVQVSHTGPLTFIELSWPERTPLAFETEDIEGLTVQLMRLSFVQAIFQPMTKTRPHLLRCLETSPQFKLPSDIVWGSKYRGKTNELVTQLGINLALNYSEVTHASAPSLLDPMAGRGTTLLWAARYGIIAVGIEIDKKAIDHFQRDTKRQTKLHKIKYKVHQGSIGKGKRSPRFLEFK